MNRYSSLCLLFAVCAIALFLSTKVESQFGAPKGYVSLQPTTPGTSQSGHANVSGTIRASQLVGGGSGITSVNADLFDGINSTAFLQSVPNPLTLTGSSAIHIISGENTSTASGASGIFGLASATSGGNYGVYGRSASVTGIGVYGWANAASGTTYGVYGQNTSTGGRGVLGWATAATGATFGGHFTSASTGGRGVYGEASAVSGNNIGVYGRSNSTTGMALYGYADATSGANYGVYGDTESTEGIGVRGRAQATTGSNYGGFFATNSTSGIGASGVATALNGTNYGVYGETNSNDFPASGVRGESISGAGITMGVYGKSRSISGRGVMGAVDAASGICYGVLGQCDTNNFSAFGVYSLGTLGASGTKPFRIDHPDDPSNKYLFHYSTESPEVLNAYSGKVVLDNRGAAIINMPDYFAKINLDPRYTLTAIGAPMPNLHVAKEISDESLRIGSLAEPDEIAPKCWFQISGGAPGAKVSWRIEAVRNDRWMQQHGAPIEVDKEGPERGTYQHPDLYGMPKERGMSYVAPKEPVVPQE